MKFADAKREFLHHYAASRKIEKAFERDWIVRDVWHHDSYDRGLRLVIRKTSWGEDGHLRLGVNVLGGNEEQLDMRDLSNADLQVVIRAREYVARWISGEIDELPEKFPEELREG